VRWRTGRCVGAQADALAHRQMRWCTGAGLNPAMPVLLYYNMTDLNTFDLINSPLEKTNLIEASAGTGKTYTITGIFLRLIIEKRLSVNEILTVTFTEAATSELKIRIRSRLLEAADAFAVRKSRDPFLDGLIEKVLSFENAPSATEITYLLQRALRNFDQAAIFTIHGFCRKVLNDNAFESGLPFDTELIVSEKELIRESVEDYWRIQLQQVSPLFAGYAIKKGFLPGKLTDYVATTSSRPYLRIIPESFLTDTDACEKAFMDALDRVCHAWHEHKEDVIGILMDDKGLNRRQYGKNSLCNWIAELDDFLKSKNLLFPLPPQFEKFTAKKIASSMKAEKLPPEHPFFNLCDTLSDMNRQLEEEFSKRLIGLKANMFRYVKERLAEKKAKKNVQSFDDLLVRFLSSLRKKPMGDFLARAVRKRFKAALIDEFQDTDPVQYEIFRKIFDSSESILFFVGDPKQAIYSFRGADIFTYLMASKGVNAHYTLKENWRTHPSLVNAVNTIFQNAKLPFVYDEIDFYPSVPARGLKHKELVLESAPDGALDLWFVDSSKITDGDRPVPKGDARRYIIQAVAEEIARLVHSENAFLGTRPLSARDIAVLVRENRDAPPIQRALASYRIPAVVYSTDNIFDSHEAWELQRVLIAISEPDSEAAIRSALVTDMFGLNGTEMDALAGDEKRWEEWISKFSAYHEAWKKRGFICMFNQLMYEETVLPRLMTFLDGERRCTNLLHLRDILNRVSVLEKPGMSDLIQWLSVQRNPASTRLDEHQIRLESDEDAVHIVTMHRSKGLEYPVTFCPFLWTGSAVGKNDSPLIFHDPEQAMRATLDLGSSAFESHRVMKEKEILAENIRLFYVALTRAKNRCYLVWGRFNQAGSSAPAYIFHHSAKTEDMVPLKAMEKNFSAMTDEQVKNDLTRLGKVSNGSINVYDMPMGHEDMPLAICGYDSPDLVCRYFSGNIDRAWRISSFSSLISGYGPLIEEAKDYDPEVPGEGVNGEGDDAEKSANISIAVGDQDILNPAMPVYEEDEEPPERDIHVFPRGVRAGTFMHDVLEHLDFNNTSQEAVRLLVTSKLNQYGFDMSWLDAICVMVKNVVNTPLNMDGLRLRNIKTEDRLNETEFYFPLKPVSSGRFQEIVSEYYDCCSDDMIPEGIKGLQFSETKGFMKGFIDLIFTWRGHYYLVDWKSNFLGMSIDDYNQKALSACMNRHFYVFQYLVYTLALDQYLKLRVPNYQYKTHFAGVFYIFLRGLDPDRGPSFGIYHDLPSQELIRALSDALIGSTHS